MIQCYEVEDLSNVVIWRSHISVNRHNHGLFPKSYAVAWLGGAGRPPLFQMETPKQWPSYDFLVQSINLKILLNNPTNSRNFYKFSNKHHFGSFVRGGLLPPLPPLSYASVPKFLSKIILNQAGPRTFPRVFSQTTHLKPPAYSTLTTLLQARVVINCRKAQKNKVNKIQTHSYWLL